MINQKINKIILAIIIIIGIILIVFAVQYRNNKIQRYLDICQNQNFSQVGFIKEENLCVNLTCLNQISKNKEPLYYELGNEVINNTQIYVLEKGNYNTIKYEPCYYKPVEVENG